MAEADVVIVGAGQSGSLLAARLGEAGHKVVVLEGGPERKLEQLYSSTIWQRKLKWGGPPVRSVGNDPMPYVYGSGWGTGGSTVHHMANWFRLHPEDFKVATLYGKGLDWPISYDDLRPWYDAVQREIGISGDAAQEVWRPPGEPYPMPPQPTFKQGEILAAGFKKLGFRTAPLPQAITSVEYNGRPACIQDGWCDAGCPTGALANPLVIFAPTMRKAGVEIRHHSYVSRVLTDASGRRARSVEYFDEQGQVHTIDAKLVIISAFAVQSPRILLSSTSDKHPNGLANSSGLVGRYFMGHASNGLAGMFNEETEAYMGRSGGQLVSQEKYLKDTKRGYVCGYSWTIGSSFKLADMTGLSNNKPELYGDTLKTFVEKAAKHIAKMGIMADDLPVLDNRVELTAEKDRFGLPVPKITHSFSADTRMCVEEAVEEGKSILNAAGATEVWVGRIGAIHLMGGTVMGDDATRSVTNSYGQTHDVENLFISGTGLFPTIGAINPTFTMTALAARTADYIKKEWAGLSAA